LSESLRRASPDLDALCESARLPDLTSRAAIAKIS
jgi:hypothetical protein